MDSNNIQKKIAYLIEHMDNFLEHELYNILEDDENDLHHSAVAVSNLIVCMRDIEKWLYGASCYSNLKAFLENKLLTEAEIDLILKRYEAESKIYIGHQFAP